MLQELGPVADSVDIVCRIGRDALDGSITADALKELTEASKHHARLMLPFADSVKKLAEDYLAATTSR